MSADKRTPLHERINAAQQALDEAKRLQLDAYSTDITTPEQAARGEERRRRNPTVNKRLLETAERIVSDVAAPGSGKPVSAKRYSVADLCESLHVGNDTLRKLVRGAGVPAAKVGGRNHTWNEQERITLLEYARDHGAPTVQNAARALLDNPK